MLGGSDEVGVVGLSSTAFGPGQERVPLSTGDPDQSAATRGTKDRVQDPLGWK